MSQERGTSSAGRLASSSIMSGGGHESSCSALAPEEVVQHHDGHVPDGESGEHEQSDEEQFQREIHGSILCRARAYFVETAIRPRIAVVTPRITTDPPRLAITRLTKPIFCSVASCAQKVARVPPASTIGIHDPYSATGERIPTSAAPMATRTHTGITLRSARAMPG